MLNIIKRQTFSFLQQAMIAIVLFFITFSSLGFLGTTIASADTSNSADKTQSSVKGKTYTVATDTTYAPFEFRGGDNELQGIDIDLMNAIAEDQGFKVKWDSVGFDAAVQSLQSNQADAVMAGMSITDERKKTFNFSDSYFEGAISIAVSSKMDSSEVPKALEDMKGYTVAVKTGTEGQTYAESLKKKYDLNILTYGSSSELVSAVDAGHAKALFEDYPVIKYGVAQGNGMQMTEIPEKKGGQYGVAVNKGKNAELIEAFDSGLKNLKDNGKYKEIVDKYLNPDSQGASNIFTLFASSLPLLLKGLGWTLCITFFSLIFALVLGIIFGFMKISKNIVVRGIATTYVNIFRGTPVLVQAFFFYFGISSVLFPLDVRVAGILTLSLNAGAYMTEIIRGGIQAVPPGQREAGRSLGLSEFTAMRKVVLPQALKTMTPSMINQGIITLKDTSLLAIIGLPELTYEGQQIIARTYQAFDMWLIIGAIYFVVILILTRLSNMLDKKVNK